MVNSIFLIPCILFSGSIDWLDFICAFLFSQSSKISVTQNIITYSLWENYQWNKWCTSWCAVWKLIFIQIFRPDERGFNSSENLHQHDQGHHEGVCQLPAPHRDNGAGVVYEEALLRVLVVDFVVHIALTVDILLHEFPIQGSTGQQALHQDFRDNSKLNSWIAVER